MCSGFILPLEVNSSFAKNENDTQKNNDEKTRTW